jgi:uncharacterized OB-fold protein
VIDASTCPECARVDTPPRDLCLDCGEDTDPTRLDPDGRVLARTRRPDSPPVVLVELAEQARVLARAPENPSVGDRVRVEPGEVFTAHAP